MPQDRITSSSMIPQYYICRPTQHLFTQQILCTYCVQVVTCINCCVPSISLIVLGQTLALWLKHVHLILEALGVSPSSALSPSFLLM